MRSARNTPEVFECFFRRHTLVSVALLYANIQKVRSRYLVHRHVEFHTEMSLTCSFTSSVQTAVCNQNIKVLDDLYPILHSDGSWYASITAKIEWAYDYIESLGSSASALHYLVARNSFD